MRAHKTAEISFCDSGDVSAGRVGHKLLLKLSRADGFMTNGLAPSQKYNLVTMHLYQLTEY